MYQDTPIPCLENCQKNEEGKKCRTVGARVLGPLLLVFMTYNYEMRMHRKYACIIIFQNE